ncbi:23S rRNA (adenine(2503)-C(2))-methyltransferase RlmN [Candidatus Kuenenbacteria bacterium CG_4_8_14_3_um_filter_39_15]|uniref:Probable dual-specificity RNA methyltransferase RlmN n=6 Tax=Candidatus Kueneniibacteriota TaxID=1752740 RepID=A0A2M7IL15_9BACT|nr:MAG: 23S rRNA (adenine(2503)-C(2))-methyltransferase [Candidatus Kuenenbacteria bacterium CG2_30_39_24]PIP28904.1 MAG: 23S rRNA (adenine(2503)-C(2))-methyltransferase RlmN [Candidatus Kuenenbacteria bacterium CG23_combo_of_CG06-09_8_20_14_all_39_39]PIW95458.1 MAG: 23S rRNA (adenine(2503)-C(2))-methyltransferase RlmN [Candidatus Kuenenbacteria bacterium CG_4_8_14_3_um_filter_39_15]PIX92116.1 MAG: 23S rRNA (adenine(2503)-C(2))-methyltransferase RlmN [Candidatus Kuenenbacteria bacterium CG_4_10_
MRFEEILKDEPAYRIKQAKQAVFKDLADNWQTVTTLPLAWREKLEKEASLKINCEIFEDKKQSAAKALIILEDGNKIETVLIRHAAGRQTVCVSSQVGCPLGCKFCATGKLGFKRNLSAQKIVNQLIVWNRFLKSQGTDKRVTNVVFMGMGEPFLNYEQVISAIQIIHDPDGFNLGARRFSISTVGITEGIEKLGKEKLQINLAISLHAPTDALRQKLIPINKKYPLHKIFRAVDNYLVKTKRRVMFEYLMIKGVNDSLKEARELVKLMRHSLYLVNLIVYNPTQNFQASTRTTVQRFKEYLKSHGVAVTERYRFGREIEAACGQLALKAN